MKKSILAAFIALALALPLTSPAFADPPGKDYYEEQKKAMEQEREYHKKQRKLQRGRQKHSE